MPLFLDLESKIVVVFGGGHIGEHKARLFSEYASVSVVSKSFTDGLIQMEKARAVRLIRADLCEGYDDYLRDAFIAVPATSDIELNRKIEHRAGDLGVLVNSVDGIGDIVVPSIIRKEPISIAISTESPALSKYLRLRLERELTENFQGMAKLLVRIRDDLKRSVPDQRERSRRIWAVLSDDEIWRLLDESYEKAYMKAREEVSLNERNSLDASDPSQGLDR
ncbi:MAG: bifunctional precorrin-2 dehydrogenase/sirohydrochlorin ferrochelatase [Methanotrichaceae archaeon]